MSWIALRVHAPDDAARESLLAALFAAGAAGVEEQGSLLLTHLEDGADLHALHDAAARHPGARVEMEPVGDIDWSQAWPTQVGVQRLGRIALAPPWLATEASDVEVVVEIDPGMAFGTGEHPTTRGVVRLMQGVVRPGDAVADLGAGSAVLAICAARLGAARCFAIEMDEDAIANAEENAARNGVGDRVAVLHGDAAALLPVVAPVRVILANIISSVLAELAPVMKKALAPGGVAILSGVLRTERDALLQALETQGWHCTAEDAEGDWWSGIVAPR